VNNSSGVLHIRDKSKTESGHSKRDNRDDEADSCDDRESENVDGVHDAADSVDIHQDRKVRQVIAATHCVRFVALDGGAARRRPAQCRRVPVNALASSVPRRCLLVLQQDLSTGFHFRLTLAGNVTNQLSFSISSAAKLNARSEASRQNTSNFYF
jgi:hypothetical protein